MQLKNVIGLQPGDAASGMTLIVCGCAFMIISLEKLIPILKTVQDAAPVKQ